MCTFSMSTIENENMSKKKNRGQCKNVTVLGGVVLFPRLFLHPWFYIPFVFTPRPSYSPSYKETPKMERERGVAILLK
jgi:hypothetical protein